LALHLLLNARFWPEAGAGDRLLSTRIERWVAARKSLMVRWIKREQAVCRRYEQVSGIRMAVGVMRLAVDFEKHCGVDFECESVSTRHAN
jgi:hypothetical protein